MKKKFSWKVFISFTLTFSFFIIFLTGIILYLKPPGRVAHWINWTIFGFNKETWQEIHTVFSFIFVIFSVLHLFWINWKGFWSYIISKKHSGFNKLKEFTISLVIVVALVLGTIYNLPPVSYVIDYGEYLSESWENEELSTPPIPHAEDLSLLELSNELDSISLDHIRKTLKQNNVIFDNALQTLNEIAIMNNLTPNKIYDIIVDTDIAKTSNSNGSGQGKQGSGLGRKTLIQISQEMNLDVNKLIKIIEESGYQCKADETLKDIASNNDISPRDIFTIIENIE